MPAPTASIVIPTRARPEYLEVALASIAPQAAAAGAEVLVVDDAGPSSGARIQAERFGARYEPHEGPRGLNIARNTGVERSLAGLVVFVDDDIRATPDWLQALLRGVAENPGVAVFTGPIRARLEGSPPRGCGRERAPITTLELGDQDRDACYAWGANMAIRRAAFERVGPFDESLRHGGDEQEWQDRLRALQPGARVRYLAGAAVDHRRAGRDARLRGLARTAHVRGRAARRFDERRGRAPSRGGELVTLAGCAWHVIRRRCPAGLTMVAHSAGRVRESIHTPLPADLVAPNDADAPTPERPGDLAPEGPSRLAPEQAADLAPERPGDAARNDSADDFLSGHSGTVGGADALLRGVRDDAVDAWEIASGRRLRLAFAARHQPQLRRVLALGVVRPEHERLAARARAELLRSRHQVELFTCAPGGRGRFENLNRLLSEHAAAGHDWLLIVDDDVRLPRGFLDRLLFLCERFSLQLAQPAHRLRSHAAWPVTRRHPGAVARETAFVEIGPVTAFASATFPTLLPFPPLRMGWGLDSHWAALAREHGWRCGVVDAVAISHIAAAAGETYSREAAITEARELLARRAHLSANETQRTLSTHRRF
ncbi:MAG TPA: glycosyltransferase [Solirubrobacteraceae bacterium]|nr:glycosyltransferase [Solirubrobacteraceae bacterium]